MYLFRYYDLTRKNWDKVNPNDHPCSHMSNNIFINLYGEIIICPWYESLILGNIKNVNIDNFLEVINQHPSSKWKQSDYRECTNCRYRYFCLTCPGEAYSIQGDPTQASYHKYSFRYFWEKYVLPVYPDFLKEKYNNLIDMKGDYPKFHTHISQIPQEDIS
ncbi:SPASM domain-containing protein [Clostridium sp. DL1XJH146]